jgi:hypothetical protein
MYVVPSDDTFRFEQYIGNPKVLGDMSIRPFWKEQT